MPRVHHQQTVRTSSSGECSAFSAHSTHGPPDPTLDTTTSAAATASISSLYCQLSCFTSFFLLVSQLAFHG